MIRPEYDVLIVGAGPAGLAAGLGLVHSPLKAVLFDKKREIGLPIRCGELTRKGFCELLGIDCNRFVRNDFGPNILISRNQFEMHLAEEIVRRGGNIFTRAWVRDFIPYDGKKVGAIVQYGDAQYEVYAKALIICEGVEAQISRKAGFDVYLTPSDVGSCYSAKLDGISVDPHKIEMSHTPPPYPYFYWIFPISKTSANVGVGLPGTEGNRAREIFHRFVNSRSDLKEGKITREIVGVVPVTPPLEDPFKDGILVAGSAARLVDPLQGEGIVWALQSGVTAAEIIRKAGVIGDFSAAVLSEYRNFLTPIRNRFNRRYRLLRKKFLLD